MRDHDASHLRGVKRLDLDLDELTVLSVGNNTGKTMMLDDSQAQSPGHQPAPG